MSARQSDSATLDRPAAKKREMRHVYDHPYTHALCGVPRTQSFESLRTTPHPGAEYCVVCWHMHFGEFPA